MSIGDVPDPDNEVHHDLIVPAGPALSPEGLVSGDNACGADLAVHLAGEVDGVRVADGRTGRHPG
jgi:hypothetical protein